MADNKNAVIIIQSNIFRKEWQCDSDIERRSIIENIMPVLLYYIVSYITTTDTSKYVLK